MLQTVLDEDTNSLDARYKRFRDFRYQQAEGPRAVRNQLHYLCRQWLNPEKNTLKQMVDLVVLQKFMAILPLEMRSWLKECRPETTCQAVALAEGFLLSQAEAKKQEKQVKEFHAGKSKRQKMRKVNLKLPFFKSALFPPQNCL